MKDCSHECLEKNYNCDRTECRMWIDFEDDCNFSLISIYKHGALTLEQVGERIGVSFVRVRQIEQLAMEKVKKRTRKHV